MNSSRRDFIKKAVLLSGSAALANVLPATISRALAIDPADGSTFYDAEHIVFLMQENRSFDHLYGTLRGVRGFNDPRAIDLPNKNKVWLQSNEKGETFLPFRLNAKDTKAPWMGSTPHGWADQTDARNGGKYDQWLNVKRPYNKAYKDIPLTLGYCDRRDFPFYYSLADAFTVCDQHFCSSITGTHPNRWYWMTGTVREANNVAAKAHVWNISDYSKPTLDWKTFPERLEEQGISWRIYQNELTLGLGFTGTQSDWLGNFGTNVMEYFKAYNVQLHPSSIHNFAERKKKIIAEIDRLGPNPTAEADIKRLAAAKKVLAMIEKNERLHTQENLEKLPAWQRAINERAFTVNSEDPDFQSLTKLSYSDGDTIREMEVPKGDVLHQFRKDVREGKLPTVSWLMSPANFSDHPGRPWFGSWYVNEVMEILLENPEVWKKTIFVLTYDENDGFFDHVPPYAVPNPYKQNTGKVSKNIDPKMDWALRDQQTNPSAMEDRIRESSIGLGYRVPLVIASPWTRGGFVNSELFDHTSSLQFLENFIAKKFKKNIREDNITEWRRSICGDLTSVFRPYVKEGATGPEFMDKSSFMKEVNNAQYKDVPRNYRALNPEEIALVNKRPDLFPAFPIQEKGTKPACAIPYELYVDGTYDEQQSAFHMAFQASDKAHGPRSNGAPFLVYSMNPYEEESLRTWEYAVAAGDQLDDYWSLAAFADNRYRLRVYAPNGFYRAFQGDLNQPEVAVYCRYEKQQTSMGVPALTGNLLLEIHNVGDRERSVSIRDVSYDRSTILKKIKPYDQVNVVLSLEKSYGWYDVVAEVEGFANWSQRFAGHIDTGNISKTDPLMGGEVKTYG